MPNPKSSNSTQVVCAIILLIIGFTICGAQVSHLPILDVYKEMIYGGMCFIVCCLGALVIGLSPREKV